MAASRSRVSSLALALAAWRDGAHWLAGATALLEAASEAAARAGVAAAMRLQLHAAGCALAFAADASGSRLRLACSWRRLCLLTARLA